LRNSIRRISVLTAATSVAVGLAAIPATAAVKAPQRLVYDQAYGVCESSRVDTPVDFIVHPGDRVALTAGGDIWSGVWFQDRTTPAGRPNEFGDNQQYPLPGARKFALLAKMDTGYQYAGTSFSRTATWAYDQTVKLRINDDVPNNGNGCFSVQVRVYR
jgi:hypothetical protein